MSSRQKRAGDATREATRRRVLEAAAQEFLDHGYAAATVSSLARRADVSVQTLYLVVGGKPALLRAVLEQALKPPELAAGTSASMEHDYPRDLRLRARATYQGSPQPYERIAGIAHVYREVAGRAAPWWRLYRDAAATEPEIAADWARLQLMRRGTLATLLEDVPDEVLRAGLSREDAVDTLWAVASPETHELFVERLGYSLDRYETWVATTLTGALLA